jgi:hypothetical protein
LRVLPQLLLGLSMDGAGQMLGYLFGARKETTAKLMRLEFHRNGDEGMTEGKDGQLGRNHSPSIAKRS